MRGEERLTPLPAAYDEINLRNGLNRILRERLISIIGVCLFEKIERLNGYAICSSFFPNNRFGVGPQSATEAQKVEGFNEEVQIGAVMATLAIDLNQRAIFN